MSKFTQNLWSDLVQEHGPAIANASRPGPGRARRPRVIAGSTLALAVAGTALGLGLTSAGSTAGSTTVVTAAYTITTHSNGSILVQINQRESINAANQKLNAMIKEQVVLRIASGPGNRQRPGDLHAGCAEHAGAAGEGSPGRGRHAGHRLGHHRGQHGRWHLAHDRLLRLPHG